ncbi:MAG: hypothetical protein COA78_13760 [Blastopirellula sp.]|nr:MAG: hypothetical protein COA78_13760 [Blastopirellula sp.]
MSPQSSGKTAKQGINVYTMMLMFSFLSLTIGAVLLYAELQRYGPWPQWKVPTGPAAAAPAEPAPEPTAYVAPELVPVGIQKFLA